MDIFGDTTDGRPVHRLKIASPQITAHLLTYGACLQDLRLARVDHALTFGFPTLAPYLTKFSSAGTLMGPVANRITDARAVIDGKVHHFDANFLDRHTLHGGSAAFHKRVWTVAAAEPDRVTLTLDCADGEGGFPGNRQIRATYSVADTTLTLTLGATTDAPTLLNLANHSYWNLGPNPTTAGHMLTVAADRSLPGDPESTIPTGEIRAVQGTRFDYRGGRAIEAGAEGLIDVNLCTGDARGPLRPIASLTGPTGLRMEMASTEPGLQIFDGHILGRETHRTNDGRTSQPYAAFALEAQGWPDSPSKAHFPAITLRPGAPWQQITTWQFHHPT